VQLKAKRSFLPEEYCSAMTSFSWDFIY